jgi:pimeloyl-ACP methyl ester carboxylesterase
LFQRRFSQAHRIKRFICYISDINYDIYLVQFQDLVISFLFCYNGDPLQQKGDAKMAQPFSEKILHTGPIDINYAEGPKNGPEIVLLHGGSANWRDLESVGGAFSAHWHVYLPDLRGHGKSGRVSWGYSVRAYAEDIGAFLQQVSGPAALFGHSLGGVVAVMTAALFPREVRALLVGDAPLDAVTWQATMASAGHRETQQWMRALSGGKFTIDEVIAGVKAAPGAAPGSNGQYKTLGELYPDGHPFYEYMARRLMNHDPDVVGMLLEDYETASAGYELDKLLPVIQCPVLLMQADPSKGGAMTDAEVVRAMPLLRQGQHVKFTGLSHLYFWEDMLRVACEMDQFMDQFVRQKKEG